MVAVMVVIEIVLLGVVVFLAVRVNASLSHLLQRVENGLTILHIMAAQQRIVLPPPPPSDQDPAGQLEGWEHFGLPTLPDPREVEPERDATKTR